MRANWLAASAAVAFIAPAAAQVYVPIPVAGYTQDVIADAGGAALATTTAPFDGTTSDNPSVTHVLYQQGYNSAFPTLGVPSGGTIVTSPTRSYQLGPITGNNALQLIGGPSGASGTLTLVTPARDAALSLLLADGVGVQPSQGGWPYMLAVNWSSGNTTDYGYTSYDWVLSSGTPGPNAGVAIAGLDRANRGTGVPDDNTTNPVLFYYDINLSVDPNYLAGALIDSVTAIRQPSSSGPLADNILGLSGATSVPEPSALALLGATAGFAVWRRRRRAYQP